MNYEHTVFPLGSMIALGLLLVVTPYASVRIASHFLDDGVIEPRARIVEPVFHRTIFMVMTLIALITVARYVEPGSMFIALLVFAALSVPMVLIDMFDYIIPNEVSYGSLIAGVVGVAFTALGIGAGVHVGSPVQVQDGVIMNALIGMSITGILYTILHLVSSDFGMGDVKLSLASGLILGTFGLEYVAAGFFLTFVVGIVSGVSIQSILERRFTLNTTVAFGPYIFIGTLLALPAGPWFASLGQLIVKL